MKRYFLPCQLDLSIKHIITEETSPDTDQADEDIFLIAKRIIDRISLYSVY